MKGNTIRWTSFSRAKNIGFHVVRFVLPFSPRIDQPPSKRSLAAPTARFLNFHGANPRYIVPAVGADPPKSVPPHVRVAGREI